MSTNIQVDVIEPESPASPTCMSLEMPVSHDIPSTSIGIFSQHCSEDLPFIKHVKH